MNYGNEDECVIQYKITYAYIQAVSTVSVEALI